MKRGQATLFIILGIIILLVIGLSFYLLTQQGDADSQDLTSSEEVQEYYSAMEECLEDVVFDSLIYVGEHGGSSEEVRTYSTEGTPEVSDVEKAFDNFLEEYSAYCYYYVDFQEFETSQGEIEVITEIGETLEISIDYPLFLKTSNSTYSLEEKYNFNVDIDLTKYLTMGEEITNSYLEKESLCLTCFDQMSEENNVEMSFMMQEDQHLIIIEENLEYLNQEVYYFAFIL